MHSKVTCRTRSINQKELCIDNLNNITADYEDGYVEDMDEISELIKMVNILNKYSYTYTYTKY